MPNENSLIYLIEDKSYLREELQNTLRLRYNMDVVTEGTGREALERFKREISPAKCKVIILDLDLPWERGDAAIPENGFKLLESFKRLNPSIQIIVITATAIEAKYAVEAMKKGASDYILKGEGYELELFKAIDEILTAIPEIVTPETNRVNKDFAWLSKNIPMLQKEYAGKWIAIIDKEVVASGELATEVYKKAEEKYPGIEPLLYAVPKNEDLLWV